MTGPSGVPPYGGHSPSTERPTQTIAQPYDSAGYPSKADLLEIGKNLEKAVQGSPQKGGLIVRQGGSIVRQVFFFPLSLVGNLIKGAAYLTAGAVAVVKLALMVTAAVVGAALAIPGGIIAFLFGGHVKEGARLFFAIPFAPLVLAFSAIGLGLTIVDGIGHLLTLPGGSPTLLQLPKAYMKLKEDWGM